MEYKLTDEIRGGEEPKNRVIEEHGFVNTLTLAEMEDILNHNQETLKEIEGMAFNEKAKMENIEHFHPFVKEMSNEDLFTAGMYSQARIAKETHDSNIKKLIAAATEATVIINKLKEKFPELAEETKAEIIDVEATTIEDQKEEVTTE